MEVLFSWVVALLAIGVVYIVFQWNSLKRYENLPPGSMGYPFLGEVMQFFASHPCCTLSPFIRERVERYGPIFKTRLMGKPVIVSTDAEFNHFVLQQEGRLFNAWYPGISQIFRIGADQGQIHKYVRSLSLSLFGAGSLKQGLLSELDHAVSETLSSWLTLPALELKEATDRMIFNVISKRLISHDNSRASEDFTKHFMEFGSGHAVVSFLAIWRTLLYSRLQGRKKLMKVVERRTEEIGLAESSEKEQDLVDLFIKEMRKEGTLLTKEKAVEIIFLLLFASLQTTPMAITIAMKLLTEHPDVLQELSKEHDLVLGERKDGRSWISWEEYKSMTYTSMVTKEVLRMVTPFLVRKSLQDMNAKGYTIPKGWAVIVHLPSVHLNPDLFPDPSSFKPSRWEDAKAGLNSYMPFGGGTRLCPGMDFSKLLMAIFLHHLVTKYRWKTIKGGEVIHKPVPVFPNGFQIRLFQRT